MTGHTKEPWAYVTGPAHKGKYHTVEGADETMICECWDGTEESDEANARRIVSCVNALANIPDPAAIVEAARGMMEAADDALKALVGVDRLLHQYGMMEGEDCPAIEPLRTALATFRTATGEIVR